MPRFKVLLTVTTYPLPSRSYDELVCTAGVLEDGSWIRIYPVPLSFLNGLKKTGKISQTKYTWIELDLTKRKDDFRPESFSPADYQFHDLVIGDTLDTKNEWAIRKKHCLQKVYTNLNTLLEDSKAPKNVSLATFKPTRLVRLIIEKDEEDWKPVWLALQQQLTLFDSNPEEAKKAFPKVPFKFKYEFEDDEGRTSRMMIEDWEIGQLYWNCLRDAKGNEEEALARVSQKYEREFFKNREVYLFLGSTKEWHMRRAKNPFVIIGVFYPKRNDQLSFFGANE